MYLVIDPGINAGYSVWDKYWKLKEWGNISGKGKTWEAKMYDVAEQLKRIVKKYKVVKTWIEKPRKFQGVFGDSVANRGDLVKLSIHVGHLSGFLGTEIEYIEIHNWKGNLPKEVVAKRVKRLLPNVDAKSHSVDSLGMGLFLQGRF